MDVAVGGEGEGTIGAGAVTIVKLADIFPFELVLGNVESDC